MHFSSASDDWPTPQDFFDRMNALHGPLELDVCASPTNAKCPRYYTRDDDGLAQAWDGKCWMNPPYGRTIGQWMKKAYEESQRGVLVVCLVPARTDTAWWHDYATKGQVTFIRGRLKFGGACELGTIPQRDRCISAEQLTVESEKQDEDSNENDFWSMEPAHYVVSAGT